MQKILLPILFLAHFAAAQTPVWQDFSTQKMGVINPFTGEPITAAEFDQAFPVFLNDSLVRVKKNGRFGVVSITGRTAVPLDFDEIQEAQVGAEYGILAVFKNGLGGLWNTKTARQILPMAFEYARAIYPDLLVGRRKGSQILEFYDKKGRKKFETAGNTAWPGFDNTCLEIISEAKERTFLDKKGQPVFSSTFRNGRWTDGKTVDVLMSKFGEPNEKHALVSMAADTILAASAHHFQPLGEGRFFVKSTTGDRKMGFFDANSRQWLIPMGGLLLLKLGEKSNPNGVIYAQKMGFAEGHNLYDAAGKLLVENCRFDNFRYDGALAQAGADYQPFRYVHVRKEGKANAKGLFSVNGQLILPMEFGHFSYRSENHPIIAERNHPTRVNENLFNAFDPKTGKKIFAEGFEYLLFTADPSRFWARENDKWGLVETGQPAAVKFEFDGVEPIRSMGFQVEKGGKRYFFDANGKRGPERSFDWILPPSEAQYRTFKASKTAKGKLLAVGGDKTRPSGWYCINDRKQYIFFENRDDESPPMFDTVEEPPPPPMLVEKPEPSPAVEPSKSKSDHIYIASDRRPEFPGGESAMLNFLSKNMQYPAEARKNGIQGRVGVKFIVEKDGSLSDVKINIELGSGCDEEAVRLVKSMPKWKPGQQENGEIVRVQYSMWVPFKLD